MKKSLIIFALLLSGCSLKGRSIPDAPLPFASVDYKLIGSTSAEACGSYIFGLDLQHLFADQQGSRDVSAGLAGILGAFVGGGTPESGRALYDALGKVPEATNLYAPRAETEASGILIAGRPIFGKRCVTVTAQAVKLGAGPVPNAQ